MSKGTLYDNGVPVVYPHEKDYAFLMEQIPIDPSCMPVHAARTLDLDFSRGSLLLLKFRDSSIRQFIQKVALVISK